MSFHQTMTSNDGLYTITGPITAFEELNESVIIFQDDHGEPSQNELIDISI